VEVKTEKCQRRNKRALVREGKREGGDDDGKAQIVTEHVMELIIPVRWAFGVPSGKVYEGTEPIDV
jgi:hypothetical protein